MAGGQVEVQVAKGSERSYNDHPKCDGQELAILKLYVGRIGAPSRDISHGKNIAVPQSEGDEVRS